MEEIKIGFTREQIVRRHVPNAQSPSSQKVKRQRGKVVDYSIKVSIYLWKWLHTCLYITLTCIPTDCSLPSDEGRCAEEGKGQAQLVWHHDKTTTNCSPFIFYGCGGNGNRFASKNECEDTCH